MLQEILLSLSGVASPIWEELKTQNDTVGGLQDYVSPSERLMLAKLSQLSQLHVEVKDQATILSTKHPSLVCRAVSSAITQKHLAAFRKRIIEVESSILQFEATHVGGYQIVPLSTLVADFEPWIRRLEWLRRVTLFLKGTKTRESFSNRTGAVTMKFLDDERQTGFTDIQEFATHLLIVAQNTWMRAITSWVLYSQLPSIGHQDFMVQKSPKDNIYEQYVLVKELIPKFVSDEAAESILAIGTAIIQIQLPDSYVQSKVSQNTAATLLNSHLVKIKLLQYPLISSQFTSTMISINASISRNALSAVLPLAETIELCKMFKDYMLLGRGEFAISLIANSDARIHDRGKSHSTIQPVRKLGRIEELEFKETELDTILSKTWSDLATVQHGGETESNTLDKAKLYLRLRSALPVEPSGRQIPLITLLPVPAALRIVLPLTSPMRMFLSTSDSQQYSIICAYLLSLRRSQLQIDSLWTLTSQRRCHPTPVGPPLSATAFGRRACELRRKREDIRTVRMRRFWSSANKSLFVLGEVNSYMQGEVIGNSWKQFETWLGRGGQQQRLFPDTHDDVPISNETREGEKVSESYLVSSHYENSTSGKDPRTLARAHSAYLTALEAALLVGDASYIATLQKLLEIIDHFVALFKRLSAVWQGLDLQEDDGVLDAFTNFAQDEKNIFVEMERTRDELEKSLAQLVTNIKSAEKAQSQNELSGAVASVRISHDEQGNFIPWSVRTLDRLIMKLDFMYSKEDDQENIMDDVEYY